MTALTPALIARTLTPLVATGGLVLEEALVAGWNLALIDGLILDGIPPVTLEELTVAVARHMRDSRYRMTPADAWALIRAMRRAALIDVEVARGVLPAQKRKEVSE